MIVSIDKVKREAVNNILHETEQRIKEEIGTPVVLSMRLKVNRINPQLIIQNVLGELQISYSEMLAKNKKTNVVLARQLAGWLLTYYCGLSSSMIAPMVNRDESSVRHSNQTVNDLLDAGDQLYTNTLQNIEKRILQITGN
jgi:chromosomal replication initiation ATPase DnaA